MPKQRADLGFGAALDDLGSFDAKPKSKLRPKAAKAETERAAQASGFKSREPRSQAAPKALRRRRTGRNAQFNIKAKQETIDAFCQVADANDWGLGETLEYAVELLQDKHGQK